LFCKTDILDYCPSLATVIQGTYKELHLAYFSIKEYLLKVNNFGILTASISITRTCLTYLTNIKESNREIKLDFPLARYAAITWTSHAVLAQAFKDIV
jgi:hypothetical protein